MSSILEKHSDRTCTFVGIEHEPQIGFTVKLSKSVEMAKARLDTPHWSSSHSAYVLRDPVKRFVFIQNFCRIACQTLGLECWQTECETFGQVAKLAAKEMNIEKIERIGFKVATFLPIGMSHSEMCSLLPGSFLAPKDELENVCSKLNDALVQLHGSFGKLSFQLVVAPMTTEQAEKQFMSTPNLEMFLEPKLIDTGVKEFKERLRTDCFFVDVDLFRTDVTVSDLEPFLKDSLEAAKTICDNAVRQIKSLHVRK